ncbi:phage major capsid protein, partial [Methylobacterium trifolii]|uniref:phage major capsid protein n=1 Tax=Methylobacterium trifolii TaxID=1003092 RepID=UPI00403A3C61
RALQGAGDDAIRALQSTSDFPMLLADTVGRTLREAYSAAPAGVKRLGRQTTARDFRAKHRIQFSAAPTLEPVNEHGEFKAGAMAEAQESYAISTFGRIIGMTRQALVNDDLGAFADLSRRLGTASAQFEAQFLVKLLLSNPTMSDSLPLFHASHGNLAVAGTKITQDALSAARLALRKQAGLQGELISVTPKYLLVGADRETEAEKAITAVQATKIGDGNAFTFLSVVVDPRIDDGSWHIVADPAEIDGLEYAYLEGEAGPQLTSELGFTVDGMRIRVRLDFGGGFVDHRGWYRNAGA